MTFISIIVTNVNFVSGCVVCLVACEIFVLCTSYQLVIKESCILLFTKHIDHLLSLDSPTSIWQAHRMANYAKTNIKIPQIARMRIAGIPDKKIGEVFGMSVAGLAQILMSQEYKDEEACVLNGHVSKLDEALKGNVNLIRKEAQIGVPIALRCLLETAMQRKDLKAALLASKELLDRDPDRTLPKSEVSEAQEEVPEEVLNAAVGVGNSVAQSYKIDKTKVN